MKILAFILLLFPLVRSQTGLVYSKFCPWSESASCDHVIMGSSVLTEESTPILVFGLDDVQGLEHAVRGGNVAHCVSVCIIYGEGLDVAAVESALRHVPKHSVTIVLKGSSDFERLESSWTEPLEKAVAVAEVRSEEMIVMHVVCAGNKVDNASNVFERETKRSVIKSHVDMPRDLHDQCPHGFEGKHLTIYARGLPPFIVYPRSASEPYAGVDVDITEVLASSFNFSFSLHTASMVGMRLPNSGEWKGVVGHVRNGSAHFGIGNPALDFERFSAVDYTRTIYTLDTVFVAPKPKPTPPYQNILKPFTVEVWLSVSLALLLMTFVMPLITRLSEMTRNNAKWCVSQARLFPLASLMEQNPSLAFMKSPSRRILVGIWLPFVLLVTLAFSGNLRAFLVAVDYERPIDNAQDILDLDRTFYLSLGTSLVASIRGSPLSVYKKLYERVEQRNSFFYMDSGWLPDEVESELIDGGGAFLFPRVSYQMRLARLKAKYGVQPLREGRQVGFSYHVGFLVPRPAWFKSDFDLVLAKMVESGIIAKLKLQYFPLEALFPSEEIRDESDEVLHFEDIVAELVTLALGLITASIVAAMEFFWHRRKRDREEFFHE